MARAHSELLDRSARGRQHAKDRLSRGPAPRRSSDGGALILARDVPGLARDGSALFSDSLAGPRPPQAKPSRDLARARWKMIGNAVRTDHGAARGIAKYTSFESVVRAALKQRRRELLRSKHRRRTVHIASSETQRDTFALHLDALRAEMVEEMGGSSSDESMAGNENGVERGAGEVQANGLALREVLQNPTAHHFLKVFAEREFSQESLLFLDSVDELRAVPQRFVAGQGDVAQRDAGGKHAGGGHARDAHEATMATDATGREQ